jgi:serine/threonine protein kinase
VVAVKRRTDGEVRLHIIRNSSTNCKTDIGICKLRARKDVYFGKYLGIWYDEWRLTQAVKEVEIMENLRHPNVVSLFEVNLYKNQKIVSVYMELCDGSIFDLMQATSAAA